MTPQQFQRAKELFLELQELPAEQHSDVLESRCADDSETRAEVEKLLRRHRQSHVDESGIGLDDEMLTRVSRQMERLLGPAKQASAGPSKEMVGQTVGPYEVIDTIGRGGMGVVYLGRDTRLGRRAALKAVLPEDTQNAMLVERLRREACTLASLSHPNLATVYGLEPSHGTLFLAMEYIDGKTLAQRLGRNAMPIGEALSVCEQIAAGVEAAHEAGVIHRDLKPSNVMFTADGTVKVLDFGLARELKETAATRNPGDTRLLTLTMQGSVFGTPAYMSPEQARGETLDRRSDIFSFGAILFRCLTGRPAFHGETSGELVDAILNRDPDWSQLPKNLPPTVLATLRRCLAKAPADRYRHIGDVRLDLREALSTRAWERSERHNWEDRPIILRGLPWLVAAAAVAFAVFRLTMNSTSSGTSSSIVHRYDLGFPNDAMQADLERVQVACSPDGQTIVVACKTQAGQALWMRSHSDGQWRMIEQTQDAHRPFFSADGQWIGFFRNGHLYKRRLFGQGDAIHLAVGTNWYGATFHSDGSLIYATSWGDPIAMISPQTNEAKPVTKIDIERGEASHITPVVVPGTRWVLYNVWMGGETADLHAANLDTGEKHLVLSNGCSSRVTSTPRGDYLLFERASTIFAAPFDRKTAKVTGDESAIAEGVMNDGTRFAAYFDVSIDGSLVYVPGAAFAEESRMSYVNPDGTTTPLNDDRMSFAEPNFASAAPKLAVAIKGKVYRTLLYDVERTTREFILTGGDTTSSALSPDGQTIACTVNREGGYGVDLFRLSDGSRLGRIVPPGPDYQSDLAWSPDGKFLTFTMTPREGTPRDIWIVEPKLGATPRTLVSTPASDGQAAIAPNGKWFAYSSELTGRREVYLAGFPAGEPTRQVSFGGGECPLWSPDGKALYFIASQKLVSVPINPDGAISAGQTVVYDKPFGQSDPIARNFAVAPDGRPLIVEPSERRPTVLHLNVITDWYKLLP